MFRRLILDGALFLIYGTDFTCKNRTFVHLWLGVFSYKMGVTQFNVTAWVFQRESGYRVLPGDIMCSLEV